MHKTAILTTLALVGLTLAVPADATHGGCNGVITELGAGSEKLYVDDRSTGAGEINHWFYLESNGQQGLQTGGDNILFQDGLLGTFTDPCGHTNPDTLLL